MHFLQATFGLAVFFELNERDSELLRRVAGARVLLAKLLGQNRNGLLVILAGAGVILEAREDKGQARRLVGRLDRFRPLQLGKNRQRFLMAGNRLVEKSELSQRKHQILQRQGRIEVLIAKHLAPNGQGVLVVLLRRHVTPVAEVAIGKLMQR